FKWAYVATIFLAVSCCFSVVAQGDVLSISALNRALSMNILANPEGLSSLSSAETAVFVDEGALVTRSAIGKIAAKPNCREKLGELIGKYGEKATSGTFKTTENGEDILIADFDTVSDSNIELKPAKLGGEVRYVCLGGKVLGAFSLEGGLKDEAYGGIRELRDAGVRSVIATYLGAQVYGDIAKVAKILPEGDETPTGENVIFVSDRIDKTSERGILIAGEEDFPDLGGRVVSAGGSVKSIAKTIKLAKRFKKAEKRNISLIVAAKIAALAAGVAIALLTPVNSLWIAALIDGIAGVLVLSGSFAIDREIY
ncbi:MAG: hypothetical protein J6126_00915, partial [Clostridia bacterium]|nr:hypothetical protein [Clostridia bacterium]